MRKADVVILTPETAGALDVCAVARGSHLPCGRYLLAPLTGNLQVGAWGLLRLHQLSRHKILRERTTNSPIADVNAKRLTPRREELIVGDLNAPQLYRLAGLDDEPKR